MRLRSRGVISAILLTAFFVIFLPSFFKRTYTELRMPLTIPAKPLLPSSNQFTSGLSKTNQAIKDSFKLPLGSEQAWVLQVADFKSSSDANLMLQSLWNKGFKAYTRQVVTTMAGPITRVFVGPEIKSEQIKALEVRLNKEMQLKPTITAFDPLLL